MNKKYLLASLLLAPFLLTTVSFAEETSEASQILETKIEEVALSDDSATSPETSLISSATSSSTANTVPLATQQDLNSIVGKSTEEHSTAPQTVSHQEAAETLLSWAATSPKQIGKEESDRLHFASSLGLIHEDTDLNSPVSSENLQKMAEIATQLHDAYRAEKKQPLFINGKAQPIFPFSTGAKSTGYDYDKSQIVRYVVYVETDFDTDGDGKRDLVKALVQVPKAAVKGDFKASTIFEALPYITGTTGAGNLEDLGLQQGGDFDLSKLKEQPDKRTPIKEITSEEAARSASSSQWYYQNPLEDNKWEYEDLNWYNYFLVRGFAVVSSAGLGSKDSQGFNTVGSPFEVAAFKAILEWLDGKRVAYTDKTSNIAVTADWANGKVGMTGLSWGGTTNFALARTGIENLKTIVPQAGIASWYEYLMSQGTPYNAEPYSNISWLSTYVSGRILDAEDWDSIKETYAAYITQLDKAQKEHDYDYSDVFKERDYTLETENIKIPALIVHGLNDDIVKTKNFELMYQAFKKAGQLTKLYLHQGNHIEPTALVSTDENGKNKRVFFDLLNSWFSHYLYDVPNDVESLPAVTAQNNYNPDKWTTYDSWESKHHLNLTTNATQDERVTITSEYVNKAGIDWRYRDAAVGFHSSPANLTYITDVTEPTTIKGSTPVQFKAALASGTGKNLPVNVLLVDIAEEEFDVTGDNVDYETYGYRYTWQDSYTTDPKGFWQGSNLKSKPLKQYGTLKRNYKVISSGWVNLRNPESDFAPATASKSIDPNIGEFHDYTVYLQPTVYDIKPGHRLALVFTTYDTNSIFIPDEYKVTFRPTSIKASIPIVQEARDKKANYSPSLGAEPERFAIPTEHLPIVDKPTLVLNKAVKPENLISEKPTLSIEEVVKLTKQLEELEHNKQPKHFSVGEGNITKEKPTLSIEEVVKLTKQLEELEHNKQPKHFSLGEGNITKEKPTLSIEEVVKLTKQLEELEHNKQPKHFSVGEGNITKEKPILSIEEAIKLTKKLKNPSQRLAVNYHQQSTIPSQAEMRQETSPLIKTEIPQNENSEKHEATLPQTGSHTSRMMEMLGLASLSLSRLFITKGKKGQ
ncbi:CocE/NonD family hydrolase [Streptococcus himalayensis]|uniref:Xaa-Pro dipeptidyl-peptidase C-terminal domain-containing protein n=1 Tax=Streptococcus himalayensis TaxID=1888195 RepID=A0A917EFN8_9STRE|nr:CocE/NonD family hydrolase [Streptococcus himalayensis]GGE35119.1 hypothetical protein GCM10011510_15580 [Streptococcus himalayensis]